MAEYRDYRKNEVITQLFLLIGWMHQVTKKNPWSARKAQWVIFKMAAVRGMSLKNVSKIRGSFCPYDARTSTIRWNLVSYCWSKLFEVSIIIHENILGVLNESMRTVVAAEHHNKTKCLETRQPGPIFEILETRQSNIFF